MMNAPRTLPRQGLALLQALAGEVKSGCFVELSPLFGATTAAIADGRKTKAAIHSFDTFNSPPWIEKRFGFGLSRQLFDKFTAHVGDLTIHQGAIPDVPKNGWSGDIGLLFDSSARSPDVLKAHFDFFSDFLHPDTIICGGGFVGRSEQLVKTVSELAQSAGAKLYVFGQFWAFSQSGNKQIERAINSVSPGLEGITINATHGDKTQPSMAACWSRGVHRHEAMAGFSLNGETMHDAQITTFRRGSMLGSTILVDGMVSLEDVDSIVISLPEGMGMQFCLLKNGSTRNSKLFPSGSVIKLSEDKIVAVRLGHL